MASVTIGLPFFNSELTLADTIRSVFCQTLSDWELILIDDGSTDNSLAIAHSIRDSRVRVVEGGTNEGLPARLNQLASLANGQYLARMDADDLMHPERLRLQVEYLERHRQIDLVSTGACILDESGHVLGFRGLEELRTSAREILRRPMIIHPSVTGRSSWFRLNQYDTTLKLAQDIELWARTCTTSRFASIPEPLHFYRDRTSNTLYRYLAGTKVRIEILKKYGPAMVGWPYTRQLIVRAYLKGQVYRLASMINCNSALVRSRNVAIDNHEKQRHAEILHRIRKTPVPGFEPTKTSD